MYNFSLKNNAPLSVGWSLKILTRYIEVGDCKQTKYETFKYHEHFHNAVHGMEY